MDWLLFLLTGIGVALTWHDARRLRRQEARNDGGRCGHCACRLESFRVREVRHGSPWRRGGVRIDVCPGCFDRHRRGQVLLYAVLPPLVVVLLIVLVRHHV